MRGNYTGAITAPLSSDIACQLYIFNGRLIFHINSAYAEFERNLIRERTIAGLEAARARGRLGGRPEITATATKVAMAKKLYADKTTAISDICKTLNISRATLYRYIRIK